MRFLQFIFLLLFSFSCGLYASTQTLPAKVWEFGIESFDFDYIKVGVQNGDSFEFVDATGFQLQHIPAIVNVRNQLIFSEFITADDVPLDTPVVHSLENTEYYFTIHYGFTEKFMAGLVIPYIHRKLDYTDEYISAVSTMETYANALNIPPDVAYANGIGDGVLTFKYRVRPSFALGGTYRGGILQWGTDERSLRSKKADHVEELATGKVQEEYRFAAYYDRPIFKLPFQFELWYKYFSPGYAGSLDNGGTIDRGDESGFKVQLPFNVNKKLSLRSNMTYRSYPCDKRIEDGHWVAVNNTDTASLTAGLEVSYWPKRYLNVLASYTATLTNEISEFDYTFPGRLHTDYKPYIIKSIGPNETPALNTPFGGFIQNHTGFLDTKEFINHAKTFLKANTTIINEEFHWKDVVLTKNGLQWKDQDYAKIIFCNGFRISKIPPFSDLPYRLAKGHIFTVKMPDYQISTIMTKDKWIVPFKEGMYKVGATYEWQFRSPTEITNAQIKILKKELKEFLPKKITPDKIETGVRPAMVDAKPIVGPHPDFDQLVAFSGLGSKGILLAPYLAKTLSDYLVEEKALLKETLLTRFKK